MPKFSDEIIEEYRKACDKAKSNLESPMLGQVLTPLCKSCKHIDMKYGTCDAPVCDIYGENPLYLDCPHYDQIPNIDDHIYHNT